MKKFTVKDFITYNNPCFSCGEKINLRIGKSHGVADLRPTVKPEYTVIDLQITYTHTLQLWIFHKTNKIISSDARSLSDYLLNHQIHLHSSCTKCYTSIHSDPLVFNTNKGYVEPVGLSSEQLIITDEDNIYTLFSSFKDEKTTVSVDRISSATPISPVKLDLPLLPLYKAKTKEYLINKLKTYLTFS